MSDSVHGSDENLPKSIRSLQLEVGVSATTDGIEHGGPAIACNMDGSAEGFIRYGTSLC